MKRLLFALALASTLFATGCATKLKPGFDAAATWADGPKMSVGLGEYEVGTGPNPFLVGTSEKPDPQVQESLARLDERATALDGRLAEVAAKAADPSLSPAAKQELEQLKAQLEAAKTAGDAKASAAREAAEEAKALAKKAGKVDTGITIPEGGGALALVTLLGGWVLRTLQKRALLNAKAEAEARAKALAAEALHEYDKAPEASVVLKDGTIVATDNAGLPTTTVVGKVVSG